MSAVVVHKSSQLVACHGKATRISNSSSPQRNKSITPKFHKITFLHFSMRNHERGFKVGKRD